MKLLARVLVLPLRAYRRLISPWKPATCRFSPTCSEYAIQALEVHGAWRGTRMALWRLLRCQPFCEGGHDPVRPRSTRAGEERS